MATSYRSIKRDPVKTQKAWKRAFILKNNLPNQRRLVVDVEVMRHEKGYVAKACFRQGSNMHVSTKRKNQLDFRCGYGSKEKTPTSALASAFNALAKKTR